MAVYSQTTFFSSVTHSLLKAFFERILSPEGIDVGTWGADLWQLHDRQFSEALHAKISELPEKCRRLCNSKGKELYYVSRIKDGAKSLPKIVERKFVDAVTLKYTELPMTAQNAAVIAFLESSKEDWRNFKYDYLKDSPYYKPWVKYSVMPGSQPPEKTPEERMELFKQKLSLFLQSPAGLGCGKYVMIEDIPLEENAVRGIIYYNDVPMTDIGWIDEEEAKKDAEKTAGLQPVDVNRVGSIVFKYFKDEQELSMRYEENDKKILFEIARLFAKEVFNAEILEKEKPKYTLDSIREMTKADLRTWPCPEVAGGKIIGIKFALDDRGHKIAAYRTTADSDIISEITDDIFQPDAVLAGAHKVKEATILLTINHGRLFTKQVTVTEHAVKPNIKDQEVKDIVLRALNGWGFDNGN